MMTHIDGDDLALIAMGELDCTEAEGRHLAECPECALELISLRHTVAVGRSARTVELAEPGAQVWERIHAELGLSDAVAAPPRAADYATPTSPVIAPAPALPPAPAIDPAPDLAAVPAAAGPAPAGPAPAGPAAAGPAAAGPAAAGHQVGSRRRTRRGRRFWLPVAVAAGLAGLLGGVGGGIWWESLQRQEPAAPVIAEARLDPFPGWNATGVAKVEATADGHREVVVDLTGVTGGAGLREVWLIKADASGLISIGLLDGETGHFAIPDGVDLAQFPLVDVSAEPDDGNPAHSGDSIVRGELHAT